MDAEPGSGAAEPRTRRALFAHLRHELRTPINAILGYSEMLLEELEEEGQQVLVPDLEKIRGAGVQLLTLVNTLLDAEKLEQSDFDLDLASFGETIRVELRTPLNTVIGYCELLLEEADVKLKPDLERIHRAAQNLLAQISDIVALAGQLHDADGDEESAEIDLSDTVDPALLQEVVGSLRALDTGTLRSAAAASGTILVVDDNETNRDLLRRQLERQGYTATVAAGGEEALAMIAEAPYDLVLLDIIMPGMNGYQVLERLKADTASQHIPVIMISALDEIDSVVRCIEIGAEDYLPKPFNQVLLRARIGASLEKKLLRDREVAYSQALKSELDKGRQIQRNFLPATLPQRAGWEVAAYFKPARQVSGDFYDAFDLPAGRLGLVIADVCDKGVGAALFMALFRSLIRLFSNHASDQPRPTTDILQAVRATNDYIAEHHGELGMFATLFFGVLEPVSGELTYINGGHEPLLIVAPTGGIRGELPATGAAVGIMEGMDFDIETVTLEPGEMLLGFTDGVPEAHAPEGDFFTKERLVAHLDQSVASAAARVEQIGASVLAHTGEAEQFDDITMLALRRAAD